MSELIIRRYNEKDLDKVYDMIQNILNISAIQKVYEKYTINLWSDVYTKRYIKYISSLRHFYVAELDNNIVGSCTIHKDGTKGYVSCVYVDSSIQGKGIGRHLIEAVENDEVCKEVDSIYLHAVLSAIKFYQKMGFAFIEKTPTIILDSGVEVVHMEKLLKK